MSTKKLNKKYSSPELAEAFVFRNTLSAGEASAAGAQLAEARKKVKQLSPAQQLHAKVLQLRYQMDDYTRYGYYSEELSFAYFLRQYVRLNYTSNKAFAADIGIDVTELSQVVNGRRPPGEKLLVRLELHSNNAIPALSWYRLVEKQYEYELETDMVLREKEEKYVKRKLKLK